jgi:hypothetical protein
MADQIYCDGISNVTFAGNMVRLDLVTLSPTTKDKQGRPVPELRTQVVMPPEAFLRSFAMYQNLMKQLVDKGVVKLQPAPQETAAKADQSIN